MTRIAKVTCSLLRIPFTFPLIREEQHAFANFIEIETDDGIKGKALGQPVWKLLGGAYAKLPAYITFGLPRYSTEELIEVAQALKLAKLCEPYNLKWFEDPVLKGDPRLMARLRSQTTIPIVPGSTATSDLMFLRELGVQ